jgi:hypothetical protein
MLAAGAGRIINTASMASLLVPHPQKQARAGRPLGGSGGMLEGAGVCRRSVCVLSLGSTCLAAQACWDARRLAHAVASAGSCCALLR